MQYSEPSVVTLSGLVRRRARDRRPVLCGVLVLGLTGAAWGQGVSPASCVASSRPTAEIMMSCQRAVAADPNSPDIRMRYGAVLSTAGQLPEALSQFTEATRLAPTSVDAWYDAGMMAEMLSRFDQSLKSFQAAVRLRPSDAGGRWHVGVALYNLDRFADALAAFREAVRLEPGDAVAWGDMALCAVELRQDRNALLYWRQALRVRPGYFTTADPAERRLYSEVVKRAGNLEASKSQ
ncbi:MAG TPA: tetratricopeptide repeat protein [Gemmatimonadaceae bacterium]|jgi:tetratricopeptide (TPR) repeat protein|nr:tetratricopeptide repeat protein [Gemmatimonadaceae bacterium]